MKKLMFAAAAIAAGVAVADVTSANVVGYNQPAVNAGHALRTVSFVTIGDADKFDVADIVPMSATHEGEALDAKISLLQIDEHGASLDGVFTWANWGDPDVGWQYEDDFIVKGEHLFQSGTAFWTQIPDTSITDMTLQCSGAVSPKDVTFDIPEGICVGGNPFPVNVDLTTVFPISETKEGEELDASVSLLKINAQGASEDNIYTWANWGDPDVGWQYQDDFIAEGDHFMTPGQSFWISVTQNRGFTDLKLYMPCPYTLNK